MAGTCAWETTVVQPAPTTKTGGAGAIIGLSLLGIGFLGFVMISKNGSK